jgi:hypothetical protein
MLGTEKSLRDFGQEPASPGLVPLLKLAEELRK